MRAKMTLLLAAAICIVLDATPAAAQSAATEGSSSGEEIVVTARKRVEFILQTPVEEAVVGDAKLEQFQVTDLTAIEGQVPDLLLGSTIGATGNQISLRGIGTSTLNAGVDQSVTFDLDGLQLSQGLAYQAGMFDVAQVEVLKGPQALFYGKASTGGVISLHSNDPTDQIEVLVRTGYETEAAQKRGEFIFSGPVTDTLKLRLATMISGQDGYFNNDAVGNPTLGGELPSISGVPHTDEYIIRGTALWKPSDLFDFRLKLNYTDTDTQGTSGELQLSSCPGGTADLLGSLSAFFPFPVASPQFLNGDCKVDRNLAFSYLPHSAYPLLPNNGVPFLGITQIFGTLEGNLHIRDGLTLTSVTGFYNMRESDEGNDSEGATTSILGSYEDFHRRDFTEEVRLASDFSDSPVNFTVGTYIQDATEWNRNQAYVNSILGALPPFSFVPTGPNELLIDGFEGVQIDSQSVFGQLLWKITPELEFSGGARWTHEARQLREIDYLLGPSYLVTGVPRIDSYHLNPEFSLTYTPTDMLTLYASYKQASKSGSFDIAQPTLDGGSAAFGDEGVNGEEVGIKGRLFDRSLLFNLDGYHYDFSNLQVGEAIIENGQIVSKTLNAATSEVYGFDVDGTYRVPQISGLSLHTDVNYNHARFGSFADAPCWGGQTIAEGCNQAFVPGITAGAFAPATGAYTGQSLSGRPLVRAPNWSLSFGADYAMPVLGDWTFSVASNTNFSSAYYTDLAERADTIQKAYFKTNLSLTLTSPGGDWEFALIGNDLNDEITTGNCVNGPFSNGLFYGGWKGATSPGPLGEDQIACNFDPGRELWLRATYKFME